MILEYALDHDVGLLSGRHFVAVLRLVEVKKEKKRKRKREKDERKSRREIADRAFLAMLVQKKPREKVNERLFSHGVPRRFKGDSGRRGSLWHL